MYCSLPHLGSKWSPTASATNTAISSSLTLSANLYSLPIFIALCHVKKFLKLSVTHCQCLLFNALWTLLLLFEALPGEYSNSVWGPQDLQHSNWRVWKAPGPHCSGKQNCQGAALDHQQILPQSTNTTPYKVMVQTAKYGNTQRASRLAVL